MSSRAYLTDGRPEVPIRGALLPTFRRCFYDIWMGCMERSNGRVPLDEETLSICEPAPWLEISSNVSVALYQPTDFRQKLFVIVHHNVSELRILGLEWFGS